MVRVHLHQNEPSLFPFHLGQPLSTAVGTIEIHLPNHRARIFHDPSFPNSAPFFLCVSQVYTLTFDPVSQLLVSLSYIAPRDDNNEIERLEIAGADINASLRYPVSVSDLTKVCGEPLGYHGDSRGNMVITYAHVWFVFKHTNDVSRLVKIRLERTNPPSDVQELPSAPQSPTPQIHTPRMNIVVDSSTCRVTGLIVVQRSSKGGNKEYENVSPTAICFGDRYEDIVSVLGNPTSVYYKDNHHPSHIGSLAKYNDSLGDVSLAYSWLGIDVILDSQGGTISQFILHSNIPDHYQFCSYNRCAFMFSITTIGLTTSDGSGDSLLVTPVTSWEVLKSYIDPECFKQIGQLHYAPSTNCVYPFPDTTLYAVFDQMVFETTANDDIATITLLSPESHVKPSRPCGQSFNQPPSEFREREISILKKVPLLSQQSCSEEEFYDCQEDSFHSAQNSLNTNKQSDTALVLNDARPDTGMIGRSENFKTITLQRKALFGSNVNVVSKQLNDATGNVPPHSIVYEFIEDLSTAIGERDPCSVIYRSESLIISSSQPDTLEVAGDLMEESPELNSFDIVAFPESLTESTYNEDEPGAKELSDQANLGPPLETKEPEFIYQPKSTNSTTDISMTVSRTLNVIQPQNVLSRQEEKMKRLMAHTKSSQLRVREKYTPISKGTVREEGDMDPDASREDNETINDSQLVTGTEDIHSVVLEDPPVAKQLADCSSHDILSSVGVVQTSTPEQLHTMNTPQPPMIDIVPDGLLDRDAAPEDFISMPTTCTPVQLTNELRHYGNCSDRTITPESQNNDIPMAVSERDDSYPVSNTQDVANNPDVSSLFVQSKDTSHSVCETSVPLPSQLSACEGNDGGLGEGRGGGLCEGRGGGLCEGSDCGLGEGRGGGLCEDDDVLCEGGVSRRQWTTEEFTPESGPSSMTQERVLEELVTCEHDDVCGVLKQRHKGLLKAHQILLTATESTDVNQLYDLFSQDDTIFTSLISTLNISNGWTLSLSASLLPWIHQLFTTERDNSCLLLLSRAVLSITNNHTSLLLRHKIGRASSLSPQESTHCTTCYTTLEKIDKSIDHLISSQQRDDESAKFKCEEALLTVLRDIRTLLDKLFNKLDVL